MKSRPETRGCALADAALEAAVRTTHPDLDGARAGDRGASKLSKSRLLSACPRRSTDLTSLIAWGEHCERCCCCRDRRFGPCRPLRPLCQDVEANRMADRPRSATRPHF